MEENDDETTQENKKDETVEKVKRLKTDDSGVSVDAGTSSEEQIEKNCDLNNTTPSTSFPKATNSKKRNYRKAESNDSPCDLVAEEPSTLNENSNHTSGDVENPPQEENSGECNVHINDIYSTYVLFKILYD